jgi:chitin disaccharide deacetylase
METPRALIVIADDFGIGPETSRGILDLAAVGVVTGTVLLVNSPHAESAVEAWQHAQRCGFRVPELGWHPCLTLDRPIAPPTWVSSLVGPDGNFWSLGSFLSRLLRGRIRSTDIETELRAQLDRFIQLTGSPPTLVNSHQHVSIFPPIGRILTDVFRRHRIRPYVRRVREPRSMLLRIPGARRKRWLLNLLGRWDSRRLQREGFPGAEWLAGITDPPWVTDPDFFVRWLTRIPGQTVELGCHPGHHDTTLLGRDSFPGDGLVQRRVDEYTLLTHPSFLEACRRAAFTLMLPGEWLHRRQEGSRDDSIATGWFRSLSTVSRRWLRSG